MKKYDINKECLLRIQRHRYLNDKIDIEYSKRYNENIYKGIIRLLNVSMKKNNSNECLILIDNNNFSYKGFLGDIDKVIMDEGTKKVLLESVHTFTAIHNHPEGGGFSLQDLVSFLLYMNINVAIVIPNDSRKIYFMNKVLKSFSDIYFKIGHILLNLIRKGVLHSTDNAIMFIHILSLFGLKYKVFENRGL